MSAVVKMLLCPSHCCTSTNGVRDVMSKFAQLWLSSWKWTMMGLIK